MRSQADGGPECAANPHGHRSSARGGSGTEHRYRRVGLGHACPATGGMWGTSWTAGVTEPNRDVCLDSNAAEAAWPGR